jgi:peptidoglycan-N-acetylglucosamine deacetylase
MARNNLMKLTFMPLGAASSGRLCGAVSAFLLMAALVPARAATPMRTCSNPDAIGLSRVVEIDASKGQVYGGITQAPTNDILRPKEVMLTFDDGPYEGLTRRILETLDQHCTKATFFVVGQMAVARPEIVREEIARGHTVGTHTWSHPMPMKALTAQAQIEEIDKGIAAASRVAGRGLAPFFRFPGLGDSPEALAHLKSRGIATFTVDVVSNDSFIADPLKLAERSLTILGSKGKGILLFHDIKASTATALPIILTKLKEQGYKVVHVVPKGRGGTPALPAVTAPAPQVAIQQPERLPWGFAHSGPMPTILPQLGLRRAPSPAAAAPSPTPRPARPASQPKDWLDNVFGLPGSS